MKEWRERKDMKHEEAGLRSLYMNEASKKE